MKAPSVTIVKKYLSAMQKIKRKYITAERLSKVVGVYPEVINDNLSFFNPMIQMDYEYNLLELVPTLKEYVENNTVKKEPIPKKEIVTHEEMEKYASVNDFIYKKMTYAGMFDSSIILNDKDLKILKKLVMDEQTNRKHKK